MSEIIEKDIPQIRKILLDVLGDAEYRQIERMGGMTNHTYKVVMRDNKTYVVRLPGEGTEELINRADERISTQLACELGIDAKLLSFGNEGEKVSCYIDGARTLSASSFCDMDTLRKVAKILRTLHICGVDTKVPFDVFDMALGYERIIRDNSVELFDDYENTKEKIYQIQNRVAKFTSVAVPCHNDPLCENWVMDKHGKLYLIDWEYAGMNDGMWDLADVSIEADLSEEQDAALLRFYLDRDPESDEMIRFHANKIYLDFLWSLWGKARVPFDGETMEVYGRERYIRMKRNLETFSCKFPI